MKYVQEHGENKPLREMVEYLAEKTGVRVTTVTIGRMLKAAAVASEGQGRRKIRAPRADMTGNRVAWIAPEAQRATPVLLGDRVAWTLQEQSASPGVQPQLAASQSPAASPIPQQPLPQLSATPTMQSRAPSTQPQGVAQRAVQTPGPTESSAASTNNEESPTPMEGVAEQETPSESAEEAGEI